MLGMLAALALPMLAVALLRTRRIPRWTGVLLLLLAPAGVVLAGAGPAVPIGFLPLIVGLGAVARAAYRAG
jgi:hypothetical protein